LISASVSSARWIDGHHALETVLVAHVVDVPLEVDQALLERGEVFLADVGDFDTAVVLERRMVATITAQEA
jgi:hypothetical protein